MRGPWSRKTPHFRTLKPVVDKQEVQELRKAKRVTLAVASEKSKAVSGATKEN